MTTNADSPDPCEVQYLLCAGRGRVYLHRYSDGSLGLAMLGVEGDEARLDPGSVQKLAAFLNAGRVEPDTRNDREHTSEPPKTSRRRETIHDLLEAGLLKPADVLTVQRDGSYHAAIIHAGGQLETDDGESFATPSAAAMHVLGTKSEPGWDVWYTTDGNPLADLRWELRVRDFSSPEHSEKYQSEMRGVIRAWVNHRLSIHKEPNVKHDAEVLAWLKSKRYATATISSYQRHLNRWFEIHAPRK